MHYHCIIIKTPSRVKPQDAVSKASGNMKWSRGKAHISESENLAAFIIT